MNIKRLFDIILAVLVLLVTGPLMLLVSFLIRRKLGQPVFFTQVRPGMHGQPFEMLKFRTMLDARDAKGHLLPDEQRVTSFGQFLRSTSIDELPELVNVLKGDMSLVGPRPLLMEYLPLYSQEQKKRHDVRPGITGWAQINGRNAISWQKKFELDVWYVDNQSFWLDLKILFLTVLKVLKRSDINQAGQATVEPFNGNN
jgi:lipopolysaccharide/colanic/teichoic acid biosynthesis glycosyltransferase